MDLGRVSDNLKKAEYGTASEVHKDLQLIWNNAFKYTHPDTCVHASAKRLKDKVEEFMKGRTSKCQATQKPLGKGKLSQKWLEEESTTTSTTASPHSEEHGLAGLF